jgi:hypothetical protein
MSTRTCEIAGRVSYAHCGFLTSQPLDPRGARNDSAAARAAFRAVTEDSLKEASREAVTAYQRAVWGRFRVIVGECERCRELFSGVLVVGSDPLPPGHPSCTCVARAV